MHRKGAFRARAWVGIGRCREPSGPLRSRGDRDTAPPVPAKLPRIIPNHRIARAAAAILAAVFLCLAAAGCGGDGATPPPAAAGQGGGDAAAPEFGDNVVRVPGLSAEDVAAAALIAVYPPGEEPSPSGWLIYPRNEWRLALIAAEFAASPVSAGVLPTERDFYPTPIADVLDRVTPRGFPKGQGLQVILLGDPGKEILADSQELKLQLTELSAPSAAAVAAELAPYRGGYAAGYSDTVLVASAEEKARDYGLAGAGWSAFSGDTIAFVDSGGVPEATVKMLVQREALRTRQPTIYLLGPESVIPESTASELGAYGEVRRIPGDTPVEVAVELARYLDSDTGFGFGIDEGPASVTLVNIKQDWRNAYAGIVLAGAGPRAPILPIESATELPGPVREYLTELRGAEPNHAYVLGDGEGISSKLVDELDELLAPGGGG